MATGGGKGEWVLYASTREPAGAKQPTGRAPSLKIRPLSGKGSPRSGKPVARLLGGEFLLSFRRFFFRRARRPPLGAPWRCGWGVWCLAMVRKRHIKVRACERHPKAVIAADRSCPYYLRHDAHMRPRRHCRGQRAHTCVHGRPSRSAAMARGANRVRATAHRLGELRTDIPDHQLNWTSPAPATAGAGRRSVRGEARWGGTERVRPAVRLAVGRCRRPATVNDEAARPTGSRPPASPVPHGLRATTTPFAAGASNGRISTSVKPTSSSQDRYSSPV